MQGWFSRHKVAGALVALVGFATAMAISAAVANGCPQIGYGIESLKNLFFPDHKDQDTTHDLTTSHELETAS